MMIVVDMMTTTNVKVKSDGCIDFKAMCMVVYGSDLTSSDKYSDSENWDLDWEIS